MFAMTGQTIDVDALRTQMQDPGAGGFCVFEGWVRNENEGHTVARLEYEAYEPLAVTEGDKVIAEAQQKFPHLKACCVHRTGLLEIGDCAVWVGVAAAHRDEARVALGGAFLRRRVAQSADLFDALQHDSEALF